MDKQMELFKTHLIKHIDILEDFILKNPDSKFLPARLEEAKYQFKCFKVCFNLESEVEHA